MAELTTEQVQADLQHFNSLSQTGKNIHCELDKMPPEMQLQLARAAMRPENASFVTNLKVSADGDSSGLSLHIDAKKPSTESCPANALPSQHDDEGVRHKQELRNRGIKSARDLGLGDYIYIPRMESAADKAKDIEKYIDGDLKGQDQSQGWLRRKLCDLMQSDPQYRDQVLAQLEKDGATVQRDGTTPVGIKFSQYMGLRQDTIALNQSFDDMAKSAETKWDAGVENATHVSFTAAAAILRQQSKENGTLTEDQKHWFEKPYHFVDHAKLRQLVGAK